MAASRPPAILWRCSLYMDGGEAEKSEVNEANAMSVATVDAAGRPNIRMVLLKGWDADGFVFYSNSQSAKGARDHRRLSLSPRYVPALEIAAPPGARARRRQRGDADAEEADAYFATRPKDSQIGAWARSAQSRPMEGRWVF